ncbi:MAG: hypothetical protein Q4C52_02140 [Eubacteriales bacterium]|nr:hypothetical protein [Eubacteriales bacterium]
MLKRLFGGSRFIKKLNPLLELYAYSKNPKKTYQELLALEPLVKTKGERALFDLNRSAILYDMGQLKEAADVVREIPPLNPEMDAKTAQMKTKIRKAMNEGVYL